MIRLRAVFGHVDQVRDHIDRALQQDDAHHRKKGHEVLNITYTISKAREHGQGDVTVWTNWIHEEMDEIM